MEPMPGTFGPDGIWMEIDGEVVIKYDLSSAYQINDKKTPELCIGDSYSPSLVDSKHVGLNELPESSINISWYEKDINSRNVLDSWGSYEDVLQFGKITGYLIARDVLLAKTCKLRFIQPMPSWDVCLTLPLYMKLCEEIEGFENKIRVATDIGDQINGNLNAIDKALENEKFNIEMFNNLLERVHSLLDELRLAYNIRKLGYDIKFGGAGEPDYFIGDIPAEHKSRFPYIDIDDFSVLEIDTKSLNYSELFKFDEILSEVKSVKRALKKSEIYFCNLSRIPYAIKYYYIIEMTKFGPNKQQFNFSDVLCDFYSILASSLLELQDEGHEKFIIPYMNMICSDPKIVCPTFPIPKNAFETSIQNQT